MGRGVVGDADVADPPSRFQAASVARWVSASSRLCTCIRSIVSARSNRNDSSICAIPSERPLVQTLVARKTRSRAAARATRAPTAASARSYIGDVSMTVAPSSTKRAISGSSAGYPPGSTSRTR